MKIKKILTLLIIGLILFGINNSCFAVAGETNYNGKINIVGSIFKTDDSGKGLEGARFKVSDVNNTFSYELKEEGNGLYGLAYSDGVEIMFHEEASFSTIKAMLPSNVKNDITRYLENGDTSHLDNRFYTIRERTVNFYIPLFIEEVSAPKGYVKGDKIVLPVSVSASYFYARLDLNYDITVLGSRYLKYNELVDYKTDFNNYFISSRMMNDLVDCERMNYDQNAINKTGVSYLPLIVLNKKGDIKLSINNYVNNLETYTTTRGKTLNYRVVAENNGSVDSHNNVIITKIPTELEYVKGSASDGGIYNKTNHTITWKVNVIGANSKVSLRYSAYVPKNVSGGAKFIGSSSITSEEVGEIQSRETQVSLINNPETAAPIAIIVIMVSMLGVITVLKNHHKEKELKI